MNDDDILRALRSSEMTPIEAANLLAELNGGQLSQGILIAYFQRAFPDIPLRVLLDASAWSRISGGGLEDAEFEALLRPWFAGTAHFSSNATPPDR
jgi:hypothetical protein